MKHLYLNLKRFDVPVEFGGVNRVADVADWGAFVVSSTEWCDGANAKLAVIVKDAFKVDRKGRLDKNRILGLRKYEIEDEKWKRAMEAIGNSVSVTGRRRYIRFFRIDDSGREYQIQLNWTDF